MACEKWLDHCDAWKYWVKDSRNPWLHKILVLLGLAKSPTFEHFKLQRNWDDGMVQGDVCTIYEVYIDTGEKWEPLIVKFGKGD